MDIQSRWRSWAGGGIAALAAEYADQKLNPFNATLTNGEVVALGAFAADLFGLGGRYNTYVHGAGDWAVGALLASMLRGTIAGSAVTTTPKVSAAAAATTAPAPAPQPSGGVADTTIPAYSYSASAD